DLAARHEVHHHHHHEDDHHDHEHDHDHDHEHDHDHAHEHGHDAFESFVVDLPEVADAGAFAATVADVIRAHGVLRAKGFAAVAGKPMRMVLQAVGPRVDTHFDRPFAADEARASRLVVIGQVGLDRAGITAALSSVFEPA
ncbi:MAG: GTP-binding protein, partial [Pseudomonadota bacterium]